MAKPTFLPQLLNAVGFGCDSSCFTSFTFSVLEKLVSSLHRLLIQPALHSLCTTKYYIYEYTNIELSSRAWDCQWILCNARTHESNNIRIEYVIPISTILYVEAQPDVLLIKNLMTMTEQIVIRWWKNHYLLFDGLDKNYHNMVHYLELRLFDMVMPFPKLIYIYIYIYIYR